MRHPNNTNHMLARHKLLHQLNQPLTNLTQHPFNRIQLVSRPSIRRILNHRSLSRSTTNILTATTLIFRRARNTVNVGNNHVRLVIKLGRRTLHRHSDHRTFHVLNVTRVRNHLVIDLRFQPVNTHRIPRFRVIHVLASKLGTVIQHLRTSNVQLLLQHLDGLQLAHRIKMVNDLIVTQHDKRMTERIRQLLRLNQKLAMLRPIRQERRNFLSSQIVKLDDITIFLRNFVLVIAAILVASRIRTSTRHRRQLAGRLVVT